MTSLLQTGLNGHLPAPPEKRFLISNRGNVLEIVLKFHCHRFISALVAIFGCSILCADEPVDEESAWRQVLRLNYSGAISAFSSLEKSDDSDARFMRFSRAAVLLALQTRTQSNVDQAYALFERVKKENPRDSLGLEAAYMQARIRHIHDFDPNLEEARSRYCKLVDEHPHSLAGQMALSKLVMLRLLQLDQGDDRLTTLTEFEPLATNLTHPSLRFSYHLAIAEACQYHRLGEELAFKHLLAAYRVGASSPRLRDHLLMRLAQQAQVVGESAIALHALSEYIRYNQRSTSVNFLRLQIANLENGVDEGRLVVGAIDDAIGEEVDDH